MLSFRIFASLACCLVTSNLLLYASEKKSFVTMSLEKKQQRFKVAASLNDSDHVRQLLSDHRMDTLSETTRDFSGIPDAIGGFTYDLKRDREIIPFDTIDTIVRFYTPQQSCPESCRLKCAMRREAFIAYGLSQALLTAVKTDKSENYIEKLREHYNIFPLSDLLEHKSCPQSIQRNLPNLQKKHTQRQMLNYLQCITDEGYAQPGGYAEFVGTPVLTKELPIAAAKKYAKFGIEQSSLCSNE